MRSKRLHLFGSVILAAPALAHAQTVPVQPAPPAPQTAAPADRANDVVVRGARSDVIASPDRLSFNVANDLQVQNGSVADALRAVPGVEVDLEGRVSLRGDSGVTILVDGRPSAMMRGDTRGDFLQSMPAGQIERVEVITNPSAAFSPEGSAGILNLVTKKARPGTRSATVKATLGTEGRGGLSVNGSTSRKSLTLTGDLGYRRFTAEPTIEQERSRLDTLSGVLIDSRQDSTIRNVAQSGNGRIAIEYDLDKKNRLSTELSYRDTSLDMERADAFRSPSTTYERASDADISNRGLGFEASWRRTLPGDDHELVVDVEMDRSKMERDLRAVTTPSLPVGTAGYERIGNTLDRRDYGAKLDYKRPMGEGKSLNLGYAFDLDTSNFEYTGARGPSWEALVPVANLTNRFDYDQAVHALYGTFQFELGKMEFQPGLRAEQVEIDIDQVTDGLRVSDDYFRVYPTLHLGYELSAKQKLRGSYSRRIQRPSAQDLNPYTLYIDPLNLRRGNPALRPEVTDSFELSWQLRDGGTFYSATGFYRSASGGVTDVVQDLGGVFLTTRANLATSKRAGVEFLANGKLGETLSYNASGTLLWNEIDPRQPGVPSSRSGTTGSMRANITWQPTAKDYFQLNGFFSGQQLIAQGYRQSGGVLNFGYRRKIDERFSVALTGQNVLDSAKQVLVIDTPTIHDRITQRGPGRIFMLGLTWNLGSGRRRPDTFDFDQSAGATVQ